MLPPGMRSGVRLPSAGPSSRTDCPGSSAVIFGESWPSLTAVMKNSSVGAGITADNRRCAGFKFHTETGELPGAETVVSGTFKFKDKERGSCLAAAQKLDGLHIGKAFGPGMGIDGSSECAFRTKGVHAFVKNLKMFSN